MNPFIVGTQKNIQHFKCQESTHTSNNLLHAYVLCCCSHRVLPARGRFLSEIPETFELVLFSCHHGSSQSPQCFLGKD